MKSGEDDQYTAEETAPRLERGLRRALNIGPTAFYLYVRQRVPWMRAEDHAHIIEGLRKAGWRD